MGVSDLRLPVIDRCSRVWGEGGDESMLLTVKNDSHSAETLRKKEYPTPPHLFRLHLSDDLTKKPTVDISDVASLVDAPVAVTRTVGQTDKNLDPAIGATDEVVTGRGPVLIDFDLGVGPNTGSSLGLSADLVTAFTVDYPPVTREELKGRVSVFTKHRVDVDSLSSAHRNG